VTDAQEHTANVAPSAADAAREIGAAFKALIQALGTAALAASDRGDEAAFAQSMAYREAARRMADRWDKGEPSPTRAKKTAAEG